MRVEDDQQDARAAATFAVVIGWAMQLVGTAIWIYGYFVPGHSPLID